MESYGEQQEQGETAGAAGSPDDPHHVLQARIAMMISLLGYLANIPVNKVHLYVQSCTCTHNKSRLCGGGETPMKHDFRTHWKRIRFGKHRGQTLDWYTFPTCLCYP